MIRVWHDGQELAEGSGVPLGHPLARWGEGLFETMRAQGAVVPLADQHLARIVGSLTTLGIARPPTETDLVGALERVLTGVDSEQASRVRLTAGSEGLMIAERTDVAALSPSPLGLSGEVFAGEWAPGRAIGEHKSVSYFGYRDCARRATVAGADVAVLTDSHGRLGETDRGNLIASLDGETITPPIRGILPGVARAWARSNADISEVAIGKADMERCDELVMCNAVEGFAAITTVGGESVGDGAVGPLAQRLQSDFAALFFG